MHKKLFSIFVMFLIMSAYVPSSVIAQTPQSQAQSISPEERLAEEAALEARERAQTVEALAGSGAQHVQEERERALAEQARQSAVEAQGRAEEEAARAKRAEEAKSAEPGVLEILLGKGKEFLLGKAAGPGLTQEELDSLERARIKQGFFSAAEENVAREFEVELDAQNAQINKLTLDINKLNEQLQGPSEDDKRKINEKMNELRLRDLKSQSPEEKASIQKEIDKLNEQLKVPSEEEKNKIKVRIAELSKQKANAEKKYSDYTREMSLRSQHVQSAFVLTRIKAENARIDAQRTAMSSAISGIKDTIDKANKNLENYRTKASTAKENFDNSESKLKEFVEQRTAKENRLNEIKAKPEKQLTSAEKSELKSLSDELGGIVGEEEKLKDAVVKAQTESFEAERILGEEEVIRDAAEAQLKQQQEDYKKIEQESGKRAYELRMADIDDKIARNREEMFLREKQIEAASTKIQILQEALGKLDPKDPDYANKKSELESEIKGMEMYVDGENKVKKAYGDQILELQAKKRFEDFKDKISSGQGIGGVASALLGIFAMVLQGYNQYKGLAQFGSLFIGDEELAEKRAEINEEFCGTILGGTQCWTSDICSKYIETSPQTQGLVVTTVSVGEPKVVAHVEGEKSLPSKSINETTKKTSTEFTYKITYYVYLSEGRDGMSYNIEFSNDELSEMFFPEDKQISSGQSESRLLNNPVLKSSNKDYYKVCLIINPPVISATGRKVNRLCNILKEYAGTATKPYEEVKAPKIPSRFLPPKFSSANVSFDTGVEPERKAAPRKEFVPVKEPVEEIAPPEEPTVPEETAPEEATPTPVSEEPTSTPVPEVVAPTETPVPVETAPEEATSTPVPEETAPEEPTLTPESKA